MSSRLHLRPGSASLLCMAALACARAATNLAVPIPAASVEGDPCALEPPAGSLPETLSVALSGAVDPRDSPLARNPAERFVFRQLYETLVRIDCTGAVRPGLAASWSARESGRVWVFTLRPDATFWDRSPVTAADVIAAWNARNALLLAGITAQARGAAEVEVLLSRPTLAVPQALADPAWAITRPGSENDWPLGTARWRVETGGGTLTLVPQSGSGPVVRLRSQTSRDLRDIIDAGVDVLETSDPAALSYATERTGLTILPLPWDSTYVLLSQGVIALSENALAGLSRDAVRVDARAAMGPLWWMDPEACEVDSHPAMPPGPVQPPSPVWTAMQGDAPARALLERLVALRRADDATGVRGLTLAPEAFDASLQDGLSAAYVLAIPRQPLDPCRARRGLLDRAPWLREAVIVPLVDTRRHVVVRRGAAAFTVAGDGTLRLR